MTARTNFSLHVSVRQLSAPSRAAAVVAPHEGHKVSGTHS